VAVPWARTNAASWRRYIKPGGRTSHRRSFSGASDAKTIQRWIASLSSEFLKSLGCRQAPSHTTIWRVLTEVDHGALQKELCGWLAEQFKKLHVALALKQLCLDGKTLRSASKVHGSQLHLVTMIEAISKTVMEQRAGLNHTLLMVLPDVDASPPGRCINQLFRATMKSP